MRRTALWYEASGMPEAIRRTADGFSALLPQLMAVSSQADKIVFTGNGASLFAALGGWFEAVSAGGGRRTTWAPAALLVNGTMPLGPDSVVVAVSTSGELRDLVELISKPQRPRIVSLTANPSSTIGLGADVVIPLSVASQEAITHTQAYASATIASQLVGAALAGEHAMLANVEPVADAVGSALRDAPEWANSVDLEDTRAVICAGGGRTWPAAMQAALMIRELSGVPAEGVEAREAVTSSLSVMGPGVLVVVLRTVDDRHADEVAQVASSVGSPVALIDVPGTGASAQLAGFPHPLALGARMARSRGWNPDAPPWYRTYLTVARARSDDRTDEP